MFDPDRPYSSANSAESWLGGVGQHEKVYPPHVAARRIERLEMVVLMLLDRLDDVDGRRTLIQATTMGEKLINTDRLTDPREWPTSAQQP